MDTAAKQFLKDNAGIIFIFYHQTPYRDQTQQYMYPTNK